ncbi:hypothetical protein DTO063F5_8994 [Paecilomyces variotii]|nr:hypothetical protein DTO063F5_8994 [Paecilomyces variotii]
MVRRKADASDAAHPLRKRAKQVGKVKGTLSGQTTTSFPNAAPTTRLDVYVFGSGSNAELGLGSKNAINVKRPRLNTNLDAEKVGVVDIAAGGMHGVALTHNNQILTWGVNDNYALGRETAWEGGLEDIDDAQDDSDSASVASDEVELNPLEATPTPISQDKFPRVRIVSVAAGDNATFALTEEGFVYGWGTFVTNEGDVGWWNNGVIEKQSQPMQIPGLEKIIQISAGNNFCLALDWRGKVFSWGRSEQSQLGRRLVVDRRRYTVTDQDTIDNLRNDLGLLPGLVALPPRKKFTSIHAASDHAFAIDSNGDTWAWGLNNYGQTGIGVGAGRGGSAIMIPQKVISLISYKMKMIQGGRHHSIGITQSGECLVWGRMDGAQTGLDINSPPIDDPTKVISERGKPRILLQPVALPIPGCVYAAAGSDHNILITSEGRAYSWGFNATYQCGQGPSIDDIPVATLIDNPSVRDKKFCWAGAGGQYSILASSHEYAKSDGSNGLRYA